MLRSVARHPRRKANWRDKDLAIRVNAAIALRDMIEVYFGGSPTEAAKAFGISRFGLWQQMSGRVPVSRPTIEKMLRITAPDRQQSRRAKEHLEMAEREAAIVLLRNTLDQLRKSAAA